MKNIRNSGETSFVGDRIAYAVELAEKVEIGCLIFECFSELTNATTFQKLQRKRSSLCN